MNFKNKGMVIVILVIIGILYGRILTLNNENESLNSHIDKITNERLEYRLKYDSISTKLHALERIVSINEKAKITHSDLDVLIKTNIPIVVSTFKRNFNYKVDTTGLILYATGIILLESRLNTNSTNSESGASGLAQMLPSTRKIVEKKIFMNRIGKITPDKSVLLAMLYLTYNKRTYKTWDKATLAYLSGSPKVTGFSKSYLYTVKKNFKSNGKNNPS